MKWGVIIPLLILVFAPLLVFGLINWTYSTSALNNVYNDTVNNTFTSGWLPEIAQNGSVNGWALLSGTFLPIIDVMGWVIVPVFAFVFMGIVYMSGSDPFQVAAIALFLEAILSPMLNYGFLSNKWFAGIGMIVVGYMFLRLVSKRG